MSLFHLETQRVKWTSSEINLKALANGGGWAVAVVASFQSGLEFGSSNFQLFTWAC